MTGDSIARHGIAYQRLNALIELRNDLIVTEEQQTAWAARLAPLLIEAASHATADPETVSLQSG